MSQLETAVLNAMLATSADYHAIAHSFAAGFVEVEPLLQKDELEVLIVYLNNTCAFTPEVARSVLASLKDVISKRAV